MHIFTLDRQNVTQKQMYHTDFADHSLYGFQCKPRMYIEEFNYVRKAVANCK